GLAGVMAFHLRGALAGADLASIARLAPGSTGAQAAQWVRDARRIARDAGRDVTLDDLVAVVAPVDSTSPDDRRVLAVHEAGHAVAGVLAGRALCSISVVARADSGGRTTMSGGPSSVFTRASIDVEIRVLVSGRAAEDVLLGAASMGAEEDLAVATRLLAAAHASGGLGADLLHRAPSRDAHALLALDPKLRAAVADDLARVYAGAVAMIRRNRAAVAALADALIDKRFLDGAEAEAIVRKALAMPRRRAPKSGRTP
ncbi:MAG: M50 family metallopeptidase, partial [Xanthobacteraceae bacterium]|nr:M50 family metallopeptidase [Xanthobacteraceae bacterium]